jgi:hypothetical protein
MSYSPLRASGRTTVPSLMKPRGRTRLDESRLLEGRIGVAVEALAARDPEVALLDEVLVEVASGLERAVRGLGRDHERCPLDERGGGLATDFEGLI